MSERLTREDLIGLATRSNAGGAELTETFELWGIDPVELAETAREWAKTSARNRGAAGTREDALATVFVSAFSIGYMARLEVETREAARG